MVIAEDLFLFTGSVLLVKAAYAIKRNSIRRYVDRFIRRELTSSEYGFREADELEKVSRQIRAYFGFGEYQDRRQSKFRNWFSNFSYHYIRHFWAVTGEALVESRDGRKLDDLFHGLFVTRGARLRLSRREVENLVVKGPRVRLENELPEFDPITHSKNLERTYQVTNSRRKSSRIWTHSRRFGNNSKLSK